MAKWAARLLCLDDFTDAARRRLPRPIFGYVAGAAEDGASLVQNRQAFGEWALLPRVLRDVSARTCETTLFGKTWRAPFGISPLGNAALAAYRADIVMARAAAHCGIPMVVSGSSLIRLEDVVREAPDVWFQAYLPGEQARIDELLARVEAAGVETLVLTVDTAVMANRENNIRTGFSTPLRPGLRLAWDGLVRPRWLVGNALRTVLRHGIPHFENSFATRGAPIIARNVLRDFSKKDHLSWQHVRNIRRQWRGNLVIKGILDVDDARIAQAEGADGVILSNHGGRQLDGAIAPLRVLPEIVDAVGDLPVMLDGGVRRGTDVLKAFALGAKFVFVGRPFLFGAAIAGQAGVEHAIRILESEVGRDLGLMGATSLSALSSASVRAIREDGARHSVVARAPVCRAGVSR